MNVYKQGEELQRQIAATILPGNAVALWALGQEGFLVKWQECTLLIDPYLTNSVYEQAGPPWDRAFESPLSPEQCAEVDYVICSHHHDDHMDRSTIQRIAAQSDKAQFIVPRAHLGLLLEWGVEASRCIGISHTETLLLGRGLSIEAHAAMHEQFEQDEAGEHKFLGYMISFEDIVLYHAGDTVGFPELAKWLGNKNPDIAMLPINGRDYVRAGQGIVGNCNYREAVELAVSAKADLFIPMHFGLFPHNDENPAYLVDYLYTNYPGQRFHMFAPGERYIYMK